LPRFTAVSETFELVGVVNGRHVTLYLDRYDDGSPVNATLELELDGVKLPVEPHAEGEFEAELPQELKPGVIAVSATVISSAETDLLAGELDLHEEHGAEPVAPVRTYAAWAAAAGLAAVVLAGLAMLRRRRRSSGNAGREVEA
jgi:MYXO-CTERM domain-containing protein